MTIKRKCNGCTLCCKLLPVVEINKLANEKCQHQRFSKGCNIYLNKPISCSSWSCRWLLNQAGDTKRPDICHYVIDTIPDIVQIQDDDTLKLIDILAIQIWVDPKYPKAAHQDEKLLNYLSSLNKNELVVGLVRFNSNDAITLVPPNCIINDTDKWSIIKSNLH